MDSKINKYLDPDHGQAAFDDGYDLGKFFKVWFRTRYVNMHGGAHVLGFA